MRRFGRVDSNQKEIVNALRKVGCSVQSLASVGSGCPDLLVGYHGDNYLLEVKRDDGPPSGRKLTPPEEFWIGEWRGSAGIVHDVDEAIRYVMASGK